MLNEIALGGELAEEFVGHHGALLAVGVWLDKDGVRGAVIHF